MGNGYREKLLLADDHNASYDNPRLGMSGTKRSNLSALVESSMVDNT